MSDELTIKELMEMNDQKFKERLQQYDKVKNGIKRWMPYYLYEYERMHSVIMQKGLGVVKHLSDPNFEASSADLAQMDFIGKEIHTLLSATERCFDNLTKPRKCKNEIK